MSSGLFGYQLLQTSVFFFQLFHSPGVAGVHPTILFSPTIVRLLCDPKPPTGLCNRFALVAMQFYFPQLDDDLLDCEVLSCHLLSAPLLVFFSFS